MRIKITLAEVKKRVKNLAKKDKEIKKYLADSQKGKSGTLKTGCVKEDV